ncbi:uncharacterized protein J4E79_009580 [Alternaria viburni]|uniref:uncharacterized protein n=1 Tax=Alternaria viburni TaxID=566460 RepID=UPI0020C351FD|nr:uncharacterized protein J4E79_009580 [Alternaria viburni]KAI4650311.1 hypothetical protein J4E79_009580 [Alternaria viburni]
MSATLRATVEGFKTGLDTHYLPQNFRDAIYATRRLGLKLLWVDALCIVQDNAASRDLEVSNMGSYYRNAFVTLSILSAQDSHVGFLKPRESVSTISLGENLHLRRARPTWSEVLQESPLNKRAWVLQERLLSRRVVHFEKNEIFWECLETSAREGSLEENPEAWQEGEWSNESFKRCLTFANNSAVGEFGRHVPESEAFMMQWYRIIFCEVTHFTYKAGFWREHVHAGLLWYADGSLMPVRRVTASSSPPSWSWASLDGPVNMIFSRESRTIDTQLAATVLEHQPKLERAVTSFAHIGDGVLMLEAYSLDVVCRSCSDGSAPYSDPYLRMVVEIFDERGVCIGTGYHDRIPENCNTQCMALIVSQRVNTNFSSTPITYFLLVVESHRFAETCYERIGIAQTADKTYGHVLDTLNIKPEQKRKVILV